MKKFTCMMLALLLCLTSVAALAESVPSKTTADLRWIEADPEKDPEDSGFYIRIVTADETNNQERVEICTEEIAKLAAAESVEAYFGEELDLKSIVGADELNVFENVELPLTYLKVKAGERKQMVNDILKRMNISHRAGHFPQQLSGGQQQRVAIARAVVSNPKIILADEPTGNLDSKNGAEVMQLLTELNREGTTIVMVTHSKHDASFAHRIINLFETF